jgi:predicted nucleic acid-binding protein
VYTIDASVWVNAFDALEPEHEISRQLLDHLSRRRIPVIVPSLVLAEVAGAISRTRQDPDRAQVLYEALRDLPNVTLLSVDAPLAERAAEMAARHRLRGADAVYAAVALHTGCILISRDNEHLTRLAGVVIVQTPEAVLTALTSAEPDTPSEPPPTDDIVPPPGA